MATGQEITGAPREREAWPALPIAEWQATRDTLHMWTQIVGKVRLALAPKINHWWEVPLYVTARGLGTSPIPYHDDAFEMEFDFIDHELTIETSSGDLKALDLSPKSVAEFYAETMAALKTLGIEVKIWPMPVEVPSPIRFDQDRVHASYDPEFVASFLARPGLADAVFKEFRAPFIGKCSPVHFFWGSFDLAVTRFSGRRAPERPGADAMTREAYSHEVSSVGFWPGTGDIDAVFYSYAAPEPASFAQAPVAPAAAFYNTQLSEFMLPYEAVRDLRLPARGHTSICEEHVRGRGEPGKWDRAALER